MLVYSVPYAHLIPMPGLNKVQTSIAQATVSGLFDHIWHVCRQLGYDEPVFVNLW
jgi:hypothetical protein